MRQYSQDSWEFGFYRVNYSVFTPCYVRPHDCFLCLKFTDTSAIAVSRTDFDVSLTQALGNNWEVSFDLVRKISHRWLQSAETANQKYRIVNTSPFSVQNFSYPEGGERSCFSMCVCYLRNHILYMYFMYLSTWTIRVAWVFYDKFCGHPGACADCVPSFFSPPTRETGDEARYMEVNL